MPAQGDDTTVRGGEGYRLIDCAAAGLPEYGAACTYAIVDGELVKRALCVGRA